jgi:GntR family transcriptional regulator
MNRKLSGNGRAKPLYQLVDDHLRGLIDSGQLVPGDLVSPEPQLARELGVSQGTVKKAIDNLVKERRLYRHQGKGTYVSAIDFNNSLFRFTTYGGAGGKPARIHKETTERHLEPGSSDICKKMDVPAGTDLLYIERVAYVEGEPVMVEYSRWRADLVPGLDHEEIHIPDLLYALIVEKYRIPVVRAEETLMAAGADPKTARILDITPGAPVLVLKRVTYTSNNMIIEVRTSKGRADKFSYNTEIR